MNSTEFRFQTEEEVLENWKDNNVFGKFIENNRGNERFEFYDGPPFATGLPHSGHILASTLKDIICRWKSMHGFSIDPRFNWDTHGLPIEYEIEKKAGIKTIEEILEIGIPAYNDLCRGIVDEYTGEWEHTITRLGRWVDFKNNFRTLDPDFMESVWWVFAELFKKGLVYQGFKVMPYSTACATPLSNFEAKQNYQETVDPSLTVKFELSKDSAEAVLWDSGEFDTVGTVYFLVWTTTPWTLPSNLALCVSPTLEYVLVQSNRDQAYYLLSQDSVGQYFKNDGYVEIGKFSGHELTGLTYVPLFTYFEDEFTPHGAFEVLADSYVKADNGTGIVHQAPAFGQDDNRVCLEYGIINKDVLPPCPLTDNGSFTDVVADFAGEYIKDADENIIEFLKESGNVFRVRKEKHSYPYCWRSDTPLIYRTVPCWFINVEAVKDRLIECNKEINWVPEHIGTGRFGKWLETANDWCVSRNRFWGTPIPIWASSNLEEIICISSVAELEELAGLERGTVTDLHRENVDDITIPSKEGHGELRRVTEVFDCWFESGSMPYAQYHYPFRADFQEDPGKFEREYFPADFIAEGIDQTRGWFYTLMVISTALFDQPAFKNVIVNGLVLAADGTKQSKRKKNYTPPDDLLEEFGADAVRMYLIDSPIVHAQDLAFKDNEVSGIIRDIHVLLKNMVVLIIQMIKLYRERFDKDFIPFGGDSSGSCDFELSVIDTWIIEYINQFTRDLHADLADYELSRVVGRFKDLIDRESRWYIKLNKMRLKGTNESEVFSSLSTMYYILYHTTIVLAPFAPFLAESLFQKLKEYHSDSEVREALSVHLFRMPKSLPEFLQTEDSTSMLTTMDYLISVINLSRTIRTNQKGIPLKMPVNKLIVIHRDPEVLAGLESLTEYIEFEINVMTSEYSQEESDYLDYTLSLDRRKLGQRLGRRMAAIDAVLSKLPFDKSREIVLNESSIWVSDRDEVFFDAEADIEIKFDELDVARSVKLEFQTYDYDQSGDITVLMDTEITSEMEYKYQAKLLIRQIQDFRKECGLIPSDFINIYYNLPADDDSSSEIVELLTEKEELYIYPQLKERLVPFDDSEETDIFADTEVDVFGKKLEVFFEHRI